MNTRQFADHGFAIGLALLCLGITYALLNSGRLVTQEDGYYYFKIAQQLAHGAGSTFDGLHLTNGYHPLWLVVLAGTLLFTSNTSQALQAGIALQGFIWAVSTVLVYATARFKLSRAAACVAAFAWIGFTYRSALSGLEFSLHALCLLTVAYIYLRWFTLPERSGVEVYGALGVLLGLTFLARTDTVLLAAILCGWLLWCELRVGLSRQGLQHLALFAAPILFVVLVYAALNLLLFGHAQPVSSAIKVEWSRQLLIQDTLYQSHGWLIAKVVNAFGALRDVSARYPLLIGTLAAVGWWTALAIASRNGYWRNWHRRIKRHPFAFFAMSPLAVYGILQLIGVAVIYHGSLSFPPWYFVVQPWLAAITIASLFNDLISWAQSPRWHARAHAGARLATTSILVVMWVSTPILALRSIVRWQMYAIHARDPLYDAAQWVNANLPPDVIVGTWNAGTIGFLSGRRVVNLYGLVNSWDYFLMQRHDLCRYWQRLGVTYLVDVFEDRRALSVVPTYPYYAACADQLELLWMDDGYNASWQVRVYRVVPTLSSHQ